MFDRYRKDVERTIKQLHDFEDTVRYIDEQIEHVRSQIAEITEQLKTVNEQGGQTGKPPTFQEAAEILKEEALRAIEETKEFDLPIFRNGLITAIEKPETFEYTVDDLGIIRVRIHLDLTAGTRREYMQAVKTVREELKLGATTGKTKQKGKTYGSDLASHMWREKYYGTAREGKVIEPGKKKDGTPRTNRTPSFIAKYHKTIEMRVAAFTHLAPFWEIVDQGTAGGGEDDEGGEEGSGKPYPVFQGRHFVDRAKARIEKLAFEGGAAGDSDISKKLHEANEELKEKLKYLTDLAESYREQDATKVVTDVVQARMKIKEKFDNVDDVKLEKLVNDLIAGIETREKVDIGISGLPSNKRVRPRVKELQQLLASFRSR